MYGIVQASNASEKAEYVTAVECVAGLLASGLPHDLQRPPPSHFPPEASSHFPPHTSSSVAASGGVGAGPGPEQEAGAAWGGGQGANGSGGGSQGSQQHWLMGVAASQLRSVTPELSLAWAAALR
jgi:hypothetical protein